MNYADIIARLDSIKALPICELNKRQPMLVNLLVDIVNYQTDNGEGTEYESSIKYQDYYAAMQSMLQDAGFNVLGAGHFSMAVSHDMLPDRAIKVGFKKEDSGAAYVAFCRMHQGTEGIPVIHDVQRHTSCYTVVMDKLTSIEDKIPKELGDFFNLLCSAVSQTESNWSQAMEERAPRFEKLTGDQLALIQTGRKVHKFFTGLASFDMHDGNVMLDPKTGRLVITDPVSWTVSGGALESVEDPIDADNLIAELELAAAQKAIEGAKRRKEWRNPESELRRLRKVRAKRKKANRKRNMKALKQMQIADDALLAKCIQQERNAQRHFLNFGMTQHNKIFMEHNIKEMHDIFAEKVRVMQVMDCFKCFNGLPLQIDDAMQARLMG